MEILYIILLLAIILNVFVSISTFRRDDFDKGQKIAQVVLIWIIPFVAAIGIWIFHRSFDDSYKPKKPSRGGEDADAFDMRKHNNHEHFGD
ncbi:hypothetical protein SOPP22_10805 [Shewanella sp. OPT22]|nr:hypothetical protein SOPP22_10805 [Shewanella sp. OPT22]